ALIGRHFGPEVLADVLAGKRLALAQQRLSGAFEHVDEIVVIRLMHVRRAPMARLELLDELASRLVVAGWVERWRGIVKALSPIAERQDFRIFNGAVGKENALVAELAGLADD